MSMTRIPSCMMALALTCACGGKPKTTLVMMGLDLDLTGATASVTAPNAATLAIDDLNSALSASTAFKDFQFTSQLLDSTNTPATAVSNAQAFVRQGAIAVITDSSQDDTAIVRLFYDGTATDALNVPILCTLCTSGAINNPKATDSDPVTQLALRDASAWNFRLLMNSSYQVGVLMGIAEARGNKGDVDGDGQFKIDVYYTTDAFGVVTSKAFAAAGQALTPAALVETIPVSSTVNLNSYNFGADVSLLTDNFNQNSNTQDGAPDVVFDATLAEVSAAFTKAYVQSGTPIKVYQMQTFRYASTLQVLGAVANGQEGVSMVVVDGQAGQNFAQEMQSQFNEAPQERDAATYDAAALAGLGFVQAMKANSITDPAKVTGDQLRQALGSLHQAGGTQVLAGTAGIAQALDLIAQGQPISYTGASGPTTWDQNRTVLQRMSRFVVQNEQFVDQPGVYDCVAGSTCPFVQ